MEKDNKRLVPKFKSVAKADKPRSKEDKAGRKMVTEVKAKARFIRISPKKARLVTNQLSGLGAEQSLDYLRFINKAAVRPITKLVDSAIANAENNFQLDKKDLYIKKIFVNDGPVLKRWHPRAHGRSAPIRKRTSHIELTLGVRPGAKLKAKPKKEGEKKEVKPEEVKVVKPEEVKKSAKVSSKGPEEKGQGKAGFLKNIFRRKTG